MMKRPTPPAPTSPEARLAQIIAQAMARKLVAAAKAKNSEAPRVAG